MVEKNFCYFVFVIGGGSVFAFLYMIHLIISKLTSHVSQINDLTDKISNLISLAYEAEHNPDISVSVNKQENNKK